MMKTRTQFDPRIEIKDKVYPPSVVQPGMSPSIAQMVKTKKVGGNLDEFLMDGIAEDAPFDSEYVDFFEAADLAQQYGAADQDGTSPENPNTAAKRKAAERSPQDGGQPQNPENQEVKKDN